MTTITIKQPVALKKNTFEDLEELITTLYDEYLEQKMIQAQKQEKFIDL